MMQNLLIVLATTDDDERLYCGVGLVALIAFVFWMMKKEEATDDRR